MTVAIPSRPADAEYAVHLDGMSWETYESLLSDFQSTGQRKRVLFDRGRMVIVSPLPKHEIWKSLLGRFVEAIADEKSISICTLGSTTWKRKDLLRGLEPDECFYIQHELQVRGKLHLALGIDPPPDLAIEIDLRENLAEKLEVYASLGFPEVWCYDGHEIVVRVLDVISGKYQTGLRSKAFGFLNPADLVPFLERFGTTDQNTIVRQVRLWSRSLT
jgi:Uma2 family endonuclease